MEGKTRRRFLRTVLVGGGALAAGQALAPRPAQALPPECPDGSPPLPHYLNWFDQGSVTIGGILTTYASAPLAARGTVLWTLSNTRSETFRVTVQNTVTMSAGSSSSWGPFNIGRTYTQSSSTKMSNAITITSTETQTIQTTGRPENNGFATPDDTAFLVMGRPVLRIARCFGPCLEPYDSYRYRFVDGGVILPRTARELRNDPGTRDYIGPETADSILSAYPLLGGVVSGSQLNLGSPRFGPPSGISPGQPAFTFTRGMTGTTTHTEERTVTLASEVKLGFGTFSIGKKVEVTHSAVQEQSSTQVITSSATLSGELPYHLNYIYDDLVFKTLLITDEGLLTGMSVAVTGTVTTPDGKPAAGERVTLTAGGVSYEVITDKTGRYAVHTPEKLPPGRYRVAYGGQPRTVTVGSGPAVVHHVAR